MFRYLISNNELIGMRNIGFSILMFLNQRLGIFLYGIIVLLLLNPLCEIADIEYNRYLNNQNETCAQLISQKIIYG